MSPTVIIGAVLLGACNGLASYMIVTHILGEEGATAKKLYLTLALSAGATVVFAVFKLIF